MTRLWPVALVALLFAGTVVADQPTGQVFGDGVTLAEASAIPRLLDAPDAFVGKRVRVDGVVTAVCEHRGCWMKITDPATERGIRIKVADGVIVFPTSAIGKQASAEGIFEVISVAAGDAGASSPAAPQGEAHQAACAGESPAQTLYLIRGTGAVIH